jgi:hypothetical protein
MVTTMSDTDTDIDIDEDSSTTVTLSRAQIRALEKKAKERDQLADRLSKLERQQTFAEAGIDLNDPKTKYFVNGYDGEMTAEAIKAEATTAGFLQADELDEGQAATLDSTQRIVQAASGATPRGAVNEATMRAEMEQALASGGTNAVIDVAKSYGAFSVDDFS